MTLPFMCPRYAAIEEMILACGFLHQFIIPCYLMFHSVVLDEIRQGPDQYFDM